jgi:hypothetical protein
MKLLPLFKSNYHEVGHKKFYKSLPGKVKTFEAKLERLGASFDLIPEEEDISPDDQIEDAETVKWIREQYDNGNIYAWFCAKVEVKYKGYKAADYLGACSYKDKNDFKRGGYYTDMLNTCIEEINRDIEENNARVQKRWNIRRAKNLIAPYGLKIVNPKIAETSVEEII